jgi:hypothetical protein
MTLTALQYILWVLGFISHALVAAVMLKREAYRRWPSLFSLAIFEMLLTLILFALSHRYALYFYTYWSGEILRVFLGLWLVFDIVGAIPGIRYTPRPLALGFLSASLVIAAGCAWMSSRGGAHTFHITMMALALDRCIYVVWGAFTICLFAAIGFCGMGWTPTLLRVASSLLAMILISAAHAYAMSVWPKYAIKIDDIFNLCTIGVWITWSGIMRFEKQSQSDRGSSLADPAAMHIEPRRGRGYDF